MLETLADHDDALMEQLLEDIQPPRDKVFDDLAKELREGQVCPVLIGVASRANGVLRLLKALRHEAPGVAETAARLGVEAAGKTRSRWCSRPSTPRMAARCRSPACSPARSATAPPCITPDGEAGRVSGVFKVMGQHFDKRAQATAGETVAFGKLDHAKTGDTLSTGKQPHAGADRR